MCIDVRLKGIGTEGKGNVLHILNVFLDFCFSKTHAPHCNLCPVRLYHIFPHYLMKGTILEKEKLSPNTKHVF